jgi:hypothetical protein
MLQFFERISALGILIALFPIGGSGLSQTTQAGDSNDVTKDEYPVYNGVLGNIEFSRVKPDKEMHVLIVDQTLAFGCGEETKNPILISDCSPMAVPPTTADGIHELLRQEFHFDETGWKDFLAKNSKIASLHDEFTTDWKHLLTGAHTPEDDKSKSPDWNSPDCAFYFSRVGFNRTKTEAIVFVFLASYMDKFHSTGDYFLLRTNGPGKWEIKGRVNYFETDPSKSKDQPR